MEHHNLIQCILFRACGEIEANEHLLFSEHINVLFQKILTGSQQAYH